MRKVTTVVLCSCVVLVSWFCRDLSPQVGVPVAGENGDVNGDDKLNIADVVYLLGHLFEGGPAPVPCAEAIDAPDFGRQVAGTYLVTFPAGPNLEVGILLTYAADGTLTQTTQMERGFLGGGTLPQVPAWTSRGPGQGAWIRTGERELTACLLEFLYDESGHPSSIAKSRYAVRFDPAFETYSATWTVDYYAAGTDPLDPESPLIGNITGTSEGRRLRCE